MPPRENPTARQARLGAELRKLRERAGRTAREAAGMLGTDQGKISHIESGRIGVSEERIRKLATFYSCSDQALLDALCAIAREHRGQFWWDEYRGILTPGALNVAELEHHLVAMQIMQTVTMPGLLQIEDYARALFRGALPELPPEEIDTRTEFRMRRKVVLERDDPPPFDVFIHEAALRMRFGGRAVMRRQLDYLMAASERPNVTVRVVPFTNEDFFEAVQPVFYTTGVVPQLDTIQIDTAIGGVFLDAEADLLAYRSFFARARKVSLDAEESRQLVHHIAREL
ncbi:helix-turn-helix domain-containing protein [Streptomyces litchfieldiae]|uniref:Helix-turn-helix transcriptional regulator n=1 Tax=Streptomyces litchfieldiae TaxID=3075543 RepID=A0ABU2MNR7_9ACTN|nr:helix-turn-helix transcriptional regulator [Streptomyces sp. DSM 44938]MDT0343267.1 helix-turn-helix transcriptional regulator [Streptomyces sp. DSM 44938]